MQANKLFHFDLSFLNLQDVGRKGKNYKNLNISRMKRVSS